MEAELTNPYEDRLAAQRRLLTDPMRMSQAQRERSLALLGMLSGDAALGDVGQAVLSQAARQQEREDAQSMRLEDKAAAWSGSFAEGRQRAQERAEAAEQQRQFQGQQNEMMRRVLSGNQGLVQVMGANGVPMWVQRPDAVGQQPVPPGGGQPSEDERKAAGWLAQARTAYSNMQQAVKDDPGAANPTGREMAVGAVPGIGQGAAYAAMSPSRQKFSTAASSFAEAVLRAATGAGVNKDEAMQKVQELTPRYGEHPNVTQMKQQMAQMYLESLQTRAGRAAPGAAPNRPSNFPRTLGAGGNAASTPARSGVVKFSDLPP